MGLQDLTPELRTRLSRVERAVAVFVVLATLLLVSGFAYYIYHTAQRKGWFLAKANCHTFLQNANGLSVGDQVKMLGFPVGEVTEITAMPPFSEYGNVYVQFIVKGVYIGYVWDDSKVKVATADFLGKRTFELVPGGPSGRTNCFELNKQGEVTGVWDDKEGKHLPVAKKPKGYSLLAEESPALGDRLEKVANVVDKALPNILNLTNQVAAVLSNSTHATSNLNTLLARAQPIITNIADITGRLRDPRGSLGEWLIPTNLNTQLEHSLLSAGSTFTNANQTLGGLDRTLAGVRATLTNADGALIGVRNTVANTDTNVTLLLSNLNLSLESLAGITSNLNSQVQANTNILSAISDAVIHADELMQGLKRHWLLRSAFKDKTNKPPAAPAAPKGKRK